MYGLWLGYQAVAWFWAGHALTARPARIGSVVAQGAVGIGLVGWVVIRTIRYSRKQERLRAEMIAELRAGRSLPVEPSLEPFRGNAQTPQREMAGAASIARGE
jgi:hypothetical protein